MSVLRARLKADQRGFTLPEVLVTIMMMIVVLFALYSIFDMGIRVFALGNDKLEATQNARLGLERMEREIRAAYPQTGGVLLNSSPGSSITFQHKPDDNPPASVAYSHNASSGELLRTQGSEASQPVVENVKSLSFAHCSTPTNCSGISEENTRIVRIILSVEAGEADQTLTTDVNLRNRQ